MPQPANPQEWLSALTQRADFDYSRIAKLKSYVDGNAPLPELGKNTREAWEQFQRESRTNWGLLIVEAVVNRIIPIGITVGGSHDSPLAKQAQEIWIRNRMASVFRNWVRGGLTFRESYLTTWTDDDGKALIAADTPESMRVAVDPLQPWKVRAAVRWWRDLDEEIDEAWVWTPQGERQRFTRSHQGDPRDPKDSGIPLRLSGAWTPVGDPDEEVGPPPVVLYNNPGDAGEFELHIDVINRINRGILRRLTTEAIQLFRQRALKKEKGVELPEKDAKGNVIDYAKLFEPAPGVIWDLPAGIDLWESQTTDTGPMLSGSKDDIRQLASATRTPFPALMPDNANQTAEGADAARDGHIFKCMERLEIAEIGVEAALKMALETEGAVLGPNDVVDVMFKPVDRVTLSEMYAAALAAKNSGESWQSIARNILGYSPQQIAQDGIDRAHEQLLAAKSFQAPPPKAISAPSKALPPAQAAQQQAALPNA